MNDVLLTRDLPVPLSDGTVLRADVWRGAGSPAGPAILVRTPYLKETITPSVQIDPRAAVDRGMSVVVQDVRGTGTSAGSFVPFAHEVGDGAETIEWVRRQPWCDGRVVMAGMSYVGATQWMAAKTRPDGLVAIAPTLSSDEYAEGWSFTDGVLELGFVSSWSAANLAPLERRWFDQVERAFVDHSGVAEVAPWFPTWLESAPGSEYWQRHSVGALAGGELPAFVTAGWYDIFARASVRSFYRHRHPSSRLVLGPWAHDPELSHLVGEHNVGVAGSGLAWGFARRLLDWYDVVLAGAEPSTAPVTAYVLEARRWVDLPAWPPPTAVEETMELAVPADSAFDVDPLSLPQSRGGRGLQVLVPGWGFGIRDQRLLVDRPDVVVLPLHPLPDRRVWAGPITVDLPVRARGGMTRQWVATLCLERPDGTLHNLAEGVAEADVGRDTVTIELGDLCVELAAGSRLAVVVAGGSVPRWRPPAAPGRQEVLAGARLRAQRADDILGR